MELLKPRICEMAENKTIEHLSGLEGYIGLNLFNEDETMKEEYQPIFDNYYDQIYKYLNVF